MADGDSSSGEGTRKYDELGEAVQLDVTSSEDEDEEADQLDSVDQEENRNLMQDFMQEELTKQLIQQDRQPPFNKQIPIQSAARTFEDKLEPANKSNTTKDLPSSLIKQQERQRNFLVAQLVDPNEGRTGDGRQRARCLFRDNSDQDGSLLAKLMQEQNHYHGGSGGDGGGGGGQSARLNLADVSGEASSCERRIGSSSSSSSNQLDNSQQLHSRQLETGPTEQRSRSTSGNSFGDDQLKGRSIDLDEHVKLVDLFGVQIVALTINSKERLCLAQISNTLLKEFSYNEIHNRRVALGITCVQCTPIQLEMLRRAGAMPSSSRRCGMITMREAERLCKSFLAEEQPPELPENFYFTVAHRVNYGCRGRFVPARYISSRAKCIECFTCGDFFSPNKFIFHSHKDSANTDCNPPDSPNINSWRKHINLDWTHEHSQEIKYAWEDVKSLFNGGTRRRTTLGGALLSSGGHHQAVSRLNSSPDEPETGRKTSDSAQGSKGLLGSRGAPLSSAQQHNHQQGAQQATGPDGSSLGPMIDEIRRTEQTRTPRVQTLSQNERRKLPIGVWSRDRQKQLGSEHQIQTVATLKRSAGQTYDNLGHHQHQLAKRVSLHNDWQQQQQQQQQQHKLASNKTSAPDQQVVVPTLSERQQQAPSSLYQHSDRSFHLDAMRAQQHAATAGLAGLADFKLASMSAHNQAAGRLAQTDPLAESSKTNLDASMSTAGTLLYGQLYSQLMQSQLVNQADLRSHQQHQMESLEAQMALRQHIWSSLLANLRPQSQAQLEQSQIGANHVFKPNQLADYCPMNPDDQQQTSSLLAATAAAAAAAAAAASTSITSPSSNSFGGHHQVLAHQQGGLMEMSQLKNLAMKAPNTPGNPMHLYGGASQASNTADANALFNGGGTNC